MPLRSFQSTQMKDGQVVLCVVGRERGHQGMLKLRVLLALDHHVLEPASIAVAVHALLCCRSVVCLPGTQV